MSWKFGPFVVRDNDIADVDTVNETLLSITDEVSGQLNEHNWAAEAFTDRARFDAELGQITRRTAVAHASSPHSHTTRAISAWRPLDPRFERRITARGRKLWILASFQYRTSLFGSLLALELDGAVLGETLLGTGDISNDLIDVLYGWPTILGDFGTTPAVWATTGAGIAVVLEAVIDVTPGEHIIRPVQYIPRRHEDTATAQNLGDYELIVLEMW